VKVTSYAHWEVWAKNEVLIFHLTGHLLLSVSIWYVRFLGFRSIITALRWLVLRARAVSTLRYLLRVWGW
jgi:hypothetical protein